MKTKHTLFYTLLFNFFIHGGTAFAQPYIEWEFTHGILEQDEEAEDMILLDDGTYVTAGFISTDFGTLTYDAYVIKWDDDGGILWERSYGGTGNEQAYSIAKTDDGFVLVGFASSTDGDVGENKGQEDVWVLKIDENGDVIWSKVLGGSERDGSYDVAVLDDGSMIIAGYTNSSNQDINPTDYKGGEDAWLVKLDESGNVIWQKTYGGSDNDVARTMSYNADLQQLVIAGFSESIDGDLINNKGKKDIWVWTIHPENGELIWQKNYGGSEDDYGIDIIWTADNDLVFIANISSDDGDVSDYIGAEDVWVVRLDASGNLQWESTFGNPGLDAPKQVLQNMAGDLIVLGVTFDWLIAPPNFLYDLLMVKLDAASGAEMWDTRLGGKGYDFGNAIVQVGDNRYLVAGYSDSLILGDSDKDSVHGADDLWVLQLHEAPTGIQQNLHFTTTVMPTLTTDWLKINLQSPMVGNFQWTLYDKAGRIVHFKKNTCFASDCSDWIEMQGLPTGIYFLEICQQGECATTKVMKTK